MSYDENVLELSRVTRWNSCHLSRCLVKIANHCKVRWQEISPGRLRVQSNSAMGLLRQLHWLPNYISIDEGIPAVPGSNWLYDIVCLHLMQFLPSTSSNHQLFETNDDGSIRSRGDHNVLRAFSIRRCRGVGNTPVTASGFTRIVLRLTTVMGCIGCIDSCGVWLTTTQKLHRSSIYPLVI